MRTPIFLAACLSVLILAAPAAAGDIIPTGWRQQGLEGHAEKFLGMLVDGKIDEAFKFLLGDDRADAVDKLRFELHEEYRKHGNPMGYDKIFKKYAGKTAIRLRYVLLFPDLPRMFDIYYYNPDGRGWRVRTFSYAKGIKQLYTP